MARGKARLAMVDITFVAALKYRTLLLMFFSKIPPDSYRGSFRGPCGISSAGRDEFVILSIFPLSPFHLLLQHNLSRIYRHALWIDDIHIIDPRTCPGTQIQVKLLLCNGRLEHLLAQGIHDADAVAIHDI